MIKNIDLDIDSTVQFFEHKFFKTYSNINVKILCFYEFSSSWIFLSYAVVFLKVLKSHLYFKYNI